MQEVPFGTAVHAFEGGDPHRVLDFFGFYVRWRRDGSALAYVDEKYVSNVRSQALDGGPLKTTDQFLGNTQAVADEGKYVSPTELSILYAALGEREQAFASLEKAYAAHDLQLQYLGVDASFDSLHEDPRFKDLMRRVGLTP